VALVLRRATGDANFAWNSFPLLPTLSTGGACTWVVPLVGYFDARFDQIAQIWAVCLLDEIRRLGGEITEPSDGT
jgi:hypothetical protein